MYRFLLRPKWIGFHLLIALVVVVMVNLGFWQLRRLDERQAFNSSLASREEMPLTDYEAVVTPDVDPDEVQWRPVRISGTYLPDEEVLVVNRSQRGAAGRNVVTPLQIEGGTLLLVNRGFVADAVDIPPPPAGEVEIVGRLRSSEERRRGQLTESSGGERREFQRLDVGRIAPQLPGPVEPVFVELTESVPSQGDLPAPVPAPERGEGPHLAYAIQWFIFSTCAIVGWVLAVRRSALNAAGRRARADSRVPAVGEATTAPR